jgi:hypothetical protein
MQAKQEHTLELLYGGSFNRLKQVEAVGKRSSSPKEKKPRSLGMR